MHNENKKSIGFGKSKVGKNATSSGKKRYKLGLKMAWLSRFLRRSFFI